MLDDENSAEQLDAVARKRERLLQRLQQRKPVKQVNTSTTQAKIREEEIIEALERAKEQAESGIVDDATVKTLEGFLSLEGCGWSAKRIQDALELLRKASLGASSEGSQRSTFSFSVVEKKPSTSTSDKQSPLRTPSKTAAVIENLKTPENTINLYNLNNETRLVRGEDGFDVKLKDIHDCQLSFTFRPSTVHIQGVCDSKLVFLPVETSVLIYDCKRLNLFVTAQQLRIHNSHELDLHVGVRAAVIIESCSGIRMAPYRVTFKNQEVEAPPGDAWMHPNDFDWLAEGQSPNWTVAPESDWETCVLADA
ncbi:hypothetical protein Q1695_016211 [Nippostrongylus brasiliensis]|nr:hypothetical protein Q1695_016211 [Nippostrongylus brasiliensis]